MENQKLECVHPGICHLGEGPLWNVRQKKLYWTDIYNKVIWEYDPAAGESRLFWKGDLQVGGFAFTRSDDVVLCTDRGIYLLRVDSQGKPAAEPELLYRIPMKENEMFNDITVDPEGRIFAGTILRPDMSGGTLYRIEKGKAPVVVLTGLGCSNGMTFSLDEKYFFHTDSGPKRITKYSYDRKTGEISQPEVYFQAAGGMGSPDGITMDGEGSIWAAFWGGSCVRRIDPSGSICAEVQLPAKQPSSVMFGGPALDQLYITSACENAEDLAGGYFADGTFAGGPLYRYNAGIKGREEGLADF